MGLVTFGGDNSEAGTVTKKVKKIYNRYLYDSQPGFVTARVCYYPVFVPLMCV